MKMMKQLLKSKRGMALENTIVFMLVIFSLCALLTSLTLIGHFQTRIDKLTLLNEVELEQIGEDYLASVKQRAHASFTTSNQNYDCAVVGNVLTVWHKNDENKQVVLYVEAALTDDGTVDVLVWRYSAPTALTN